MLFLGVLCARRGTHVDSCGTHVDSGGTHVDSCCFWQSLERNYRLLFALQEIPPSLNGPVFSPTTRFFWRLRPFRKSRNPEETRFGAKNVIIQRVSVDWIIWTDSAKSCFWHQQRDFFETPTPLPENQGTLSRPVFGPSTPLFSGIAWTGLFGQALLNLVVRGLCALCPALRSSAGRRF